MKESQREKRPPLPVRQNGENQNGENPNVDEMAPTVGGSPGPEDGEDRRPTPVRMVMEGSEEEGDVAEERIRTVRDGVDGLEWVVNVAGRSASGILPLRTVPVMELVFAHADEPGRPLKRALQFGEKLADMTDQEILSALHGSEPFSEPLEEPEPPTRKGRRERGRSQPRG